MNWAKKGERVFQAEETACVKAQGQEGKGVSEPYISPLRGILYSYNLTFI